MISCEGFDFRLIEGVEESVYEAVSPFNSHVKISVHEDGQNDDWEWAIEVGGESEVVFGILDCGFASREDAMKAGVDFSTSCLAKEIQYRLNSGDRVYGKPERLREALDLLRGVVGE